MTLSDVHANPVLLADFLRMTGKQDDESDETFKERVLYSWQRYHETENRRVIHQKGGEREMPLPHID